MPLPPGRTHLRLLPPLGCFLVQPPAILNPPPLLNGDDLIAMQIPRGPIFRLLLDAARDAQLEEKITSPEQARELARALWERKSSGAKK